MLDGQPHVLVAHNAPYDASFIVRYAEACPFVARLPFIDSVRLARHLLPDSRGHGLDALAIYFDLPLPIDRHRALPDVRLTCEVFLRLLSIWRAKYHDQRFFQLRQGAGIQTTPPPRQESLFG